MHRMTLTNESVTFYPRGVYIQPLLSDGFWFTGSPEELISIMISHHELEIDNTTFRIRFHMDPATNEQMMHGNLCYYCREFHTGACRVRPMSEVRNEWREKYGVNPDDI